MAPREALDCADRLLRDLTDIDSPFGGKVMVLGGDFRQVLPVMPHCSRADVVGHSIKAHPFFTEGSIAVHSLTRNMRARDDEDWRAYLLDVGKGNVAPPPSLGEFSMRLRDDILAPRGWNYMDLVRHTFPDLVASARRTAQSNSLPEMCAFWSDRAVLTPTNAMVDEVNNAIIQEFPEDSRMTYLSVDEVDASTPEEKALWPLDFLHSLTPAGVMAPTSWKARVYKRKLL